MTNLCTRCDKRPASTKPYKGAPPDGLCPACRYALKRNPHAARRVASDGTQGMSQEQRFWRKVNKNGPMSSLGTPCWVWTGHLDKDGYGRFWYEGSNKAAHRYGYRVQVGEIPEGLQTDHLCRNRACVRGDHLEPVTGKVNIERGETGLANEAKTHCPQGHEYTDENTMEFRQTNGFGSTGRRCLTCHREQSRRASRKYAARKRAAQMDDPQSD